MFLWTRCDTPVCLPARSLTTSTLCCDENERSCQLIIIRRRDEEKYEKAPRDSRRTHTPSLGKENETLLTTLRQLKSKLICRGSDYIQVRSNLWEIAQLQVESNTHETIILYDITHLNECLLASHSLAPWYNIYKNAAKPNAMRENTRLYTEQRHSSE